MIYFFICPQAESLKAQAAEENKTYDTIETVSINNSKLLGLLEYFHGHKQLCDLNSQRRRRRVTLLRSWDLVALKMTWSPRKQKVRSHRCANPKAKTHYNNHVKCAPKHTATHRRLIQRAPCRPSPASPQWRRRSKRTHPSPTHTRSACPVLLWRETRGFSHSSRAKGHLRTLLHLLSASAPQHPAVQNFRSQRNKQQTTKLTMTNSRVLAAHTLLHTRCTWRQRCVREFNFTLYSVYYILLG